MEDKYGVMQRIMKQLLFTHTECAKFLRDSWQTPLLLQVLWTAAGEFATLLAVVSLWLHAFLVRGFTPLQNWFARSKHLKSKDQAELENNLEAVMVQFVHVRSICCLCEAAGAKMFSDPFAFIHILIVMSQPCAKIKKNSQQSTDRIVSRHRSASSIQSWKNSQDSSKSRLWGKGS